MATMRDNVVRRAFTVDVWGGGSEIEPRFGLSTAAHSSDTIA